MIKNIFVSFLNLENRVSTLPTSIVTNEIVYPANQPIYPNSPATGYYQPSTFQPNAFTVTTYPQLSTIISTNSGQEIPSIGGYLKTNPIRYQ